MIMEYIRNIAFFLIFIALLDNMFAFGNMKKYIKLFCGIIMIFIIMEPIGALLGSEIDFENIVDMADVELRMEEISKEYAIQDNSFAEIEGKVREIVWDEGFELTYVAVTDAGINIAVKKRRQGINIEKIYIGEEDTKESINTVKINERVAKCFGIGQENVSVNVER